MIKKTLEQFDRRTRLNNVPIAKDSLFDNEQYPESMHELDIDKIKHFLITTHIQQLEEEIKELEGKKRQIPPLTPQVIKFVLESRNEVLEDIITLKQQQIQEAKELLDNK